MGMNFKNLEQFLDWASGKVLSYFVTDGGKGLRRAVYLVCQVYATWQEEEKKQKKQ